MLDKLISQIEFESRQLDELLQSYRELLSKAARETPDLVERTALASVLHSFYTGLENIFLRIVKGLDREIPSGDQWHRELLTSMAAPGSGKHAVLSQELTLRLADYLSFRHYYRHSYSFFLDWGEMEKLVVPLEGVWRDVRRELEAFVQDSRNSPRHGSPAQGS